MRVVIKSFFITVLLGFFTVASAQLPPKIMVDKHLIHAEQLYAAKNYAEAFKVMEKIIALQKEHNLILPDEFHFKHARMALSVDSTRVALESVNNYLSATGDKGEFYKEALALLLKAEGNEVMTAEDFYSEVIKTQGTCEGLPQGSKCWMELTNHSECYVWNDYLREGDSVIWTGKCSGHLPDGKGTFTWWSVTKDEDGKQTQRKSKESTGHFRQGKQHGQWVYRVLYNDRPDWVSEGSYVDDKKHGHWVTRSDDGFLYSEGSYVDGKRQGQWVVYDYGWEENSYRGHAEGSYVDDKRQGQWVVRTKDGTVYAEGSYVDGKKQGQWVARYYRRVTETTYMDGKAHGQGVIRYPDGSVGGGPFVDGKKHGQWIEGSLSNKSKGRYVNGEKEGTWLEYNNEVCWSWTYDKGDSRSLERKNKERCRQAGLIP